MPVRDDPDKIDQLYSCFNLSCCGLTQEILLTCNMEGRKVPSISICSLSSPNQALSFEWPRWQMRARDGKCQRWLNGWFGWPSQRSANRPGFPPPRTSSQTLPELLVFLIQGHLFCVSSADGHVFRWHVLRPALSGHGARTPHSTCSLHTSLGCQIPAPSRLNCLNQIQLRVLSF